MRKKYRYSIFIASAILACAPLAMSNTMGNNHVVKAAVQPNQDSSAKPVAGKNSSTQQADGVSETDIKSSVESGANSIGKDSQVGNTSNSGTNTPVLTSNDSNDTKNTVQNGTEEAPYQITTKYDQNWQKENKVKWTKGLTDDDIRNYFMNHVHFYIKDKEATSDSFRNIEKGDIVKKENEVGYTTTIDRLESTDSELLNEKGQDLDRSDNAPILLEPNYKFIISPAFSPEGGHLLPNKWYSWKITDDSEFSENLSSDIEKRVKENKTNQTVMEQTDDHGKLPLIQKGKNDFNTLGQTSLAKPITFIISSSTDPDVMTISHSDDYVGKPADIVNNTPVVPDGGDKNKDHDADDEINNDNDSNSSNWNNAPVDNGTNFTFTQLPTTTKKTDTTKNTETKDNNKPAVNLKNLVLIHDAIVYDKNGKAVLKHGAYQMKQMHHKIVILDHGKKYRINGEWFYRIGKNEYIKVSSVGTVSKTQKIHTRGTIKASHRYGVKLYSSNGKYLKKFLSKSKKVQFDQKKFMKHAVFYRIKGTKIWVRAANVKLVKGSRK